LPRSSSGSFRIFGELGKLDHVAPQVLHQVVVEAVPLQDLEGIVSLACGLELEAIAVLVVIAQQGLEDLLVVEELLEEPEPCRP
jgi:hypothetical protein